MPPNLPTTPAEARAEQERVLGLKEGITPGEWKVQRLQTDTVSAGDLIIPILRADSAEFRHIPDVHHAQRYANVRLAAQAPTLATDLAAAYGLIATLLEAQAEREAALERVRVALQHLVNLNDNPPAEMNKTAAAYAAWQAARAALALPNSATAPAGGE